MTKEITHFIRRLHNATNQQIVDWFERNEEDDFFETLPLPMYELILEEAKKRGLKCIP